MPRSALKIVFPGQNVANLRWGFEGLIPAQHQLLDVSDGLAAPGEQAPVARGQRAVQLLWP